MQNPYPGIPRFDTHIVAPSQPFRVGDIDIMPLRVMHYNLPIVGYRMSNMAYITDCLTMPDETAEQLKGLDLLIINALRKTEHISHQTLDMALSVIERLAPRQAYLIHMSHDMGFHAEESKQLPPNVHFAYDGLTLQF
jgi:phosphoribosyl 1,2-cyclic phosphate phosphodiesterase